MAGRYQGRHIIPKAEGQVSFEVVWQNAGWFWRPPDGHAVGPFTTSSQAYQSAVIAHEAEGCVSIINGGYQDCWGVVIIGRWLRCASKNLSPSLDRGRAGSLSRS
jgi:hypothetical protein